MVDNPLTYKYKIGLPLLLVSKFLLFLLIVSICLREPYIHSREILYFLFVPISLIYGNYAKLSSVLLFLLIWGVTLLYNIIVPGSNAIQGRWFEGLINASYLFLLVFSNKRYYQTIIKAFTCAAIIVSVVTIVIWCICYISPVIRDALCVYFSKLMEETNLTFVGIGGRAILGIDFFVVWYRTSPILVPILGICYINRLKGEKNKRNTIKIVLFTVALFLSGTRANMLCSVLLLFVYEVFRLYKRKHFLVALVILLSTVTSAAILANMFLNDKGSISSSVKHLHQVSYFKTFESDYVRTAFFGWGHGSSFYSLGRKKYLDLTELSHWETIRRYGFVSFCLIMIFIWLKPLIKKVQYEKGLVKYYYVVVVLAYIFVACTNPYLLDSVGFCVLMFFDAVFEYESICCNGDLQRRKVSPQTT